MLWHSWVSTYHIHALTHWGWEKMGAVSQTTLSNAFSWMKMLEFRLRFHRSLFLRVQLTINQHWYRLWLGTGQATSHYLNQCWLVYWRKYASLGLNELISRNLLLVKEVTGIWPSLEAMGIKRMPLMMTNHNLAFNATELNWNMVTFLL